MREGEYRDLIKTILSDLSKHRKAASFTHFNYVVLGKKKPLHKLIFAR